MARRPKRRLAKFLGIPVLALCGFAIAATLATTGMATDSTTPTTTTPESPCVGLVLDPPSGPNKVSLCHFTGGTNIVLNEPSVSAFVPHTGHHGDCWRFFNGDTGCA